MNQAEQAPAAVWLGYLDKVAACAENIARTARNDFIEDAEGLAVCLLARSISSARAAARLIRLGHVVEARILTRSMLENTFYLHKLAQEDRNDFVRKMQEDEVYYHGVRGQTMLDEKQSRDTMGEENKTRIRSILNELRKGGQKPRPLKPQQVISRDEISAAVVFYQLLSLDAAHPSITALKRHFVSSTRSA